ncbi:hypothetical protein K450DRAFT_260187 [Umbelopsis ramanniana AG]|uniref:Uncharacterized protein n=1 Tax=Umbelopsis ramanniana AG TaxID=1314678 RepID=A0AAD5E107_UMBRA|nr:uncharacterized protein K450DRAFT_260187 [Umbelopsis ramanniana AG]KAI8575728.1 hypothetical protein K450DRAFT_260187 [Umbelopsis ramanniana AG]
MTFLINNDARIHPQTGKVAFASGNANHVDQWEEEGDLEDEEDTLRAFTVSFRQDEEVPPAHTGIGLEDLFGEGEEEDSSESLEETPKAVCDFLDESKDIWFVYSIRYLAPCQFDAGYMDFALLYQKDVCTAHIYFVLLLVSNKPSLFYLSPLLYFFQKTLHCFLFQICFFILPPLIAKLLSFANLSL